MRSIRVVDHWMWVAIDTIGVCLRMRDWVMGRQLRLDNVLRLWLWMMVLMILLRKRCTMSSSVQLCRDVYPSLSVVILVAIRRGICLVFVWNGVIVWCWRRMGVLLLRRDWHLIVCSQRSRAASARRCRL